MKYLSKYIYKGPDRATMEISGGVQDEIKAHLDGQFIGPTEACWKIFEFNMHGESPGNTTVLMASQATRLDKSSNVIVRDKHVP